MNIDLYDIIFFIGLILMSIGLYLINPAYCLIAIGVIFMLVSYKKAGDG